MKTKKPATHTGTLNNITGTANTMETVQLVEHARTYEVKATGQKFSKLNGCVRPASMWVRVFLELDSVKPITGE